MLIVSTFPMYPIFSASPTFDYFLTHTSVTFTYSYNTLSHTSYRANRITKSKVLIRHKNINTPQELLQRAVSSQNKDDDITK